MTRDYITIANQYIDDVLSGKILACEFVRLACERQQNDLARTGADDFPYWFDEEKASAPCSFIELLPHIEGEWAKQKLKLVLEPWQVFIITTLFGWVKEDGNRRFVKAYIEVAKKNGKSALASGLALFMLAADGEEGPQIYSGATSTAQAAITWRVSKKMVEKCPDLQTELGVRVSAHQIYCETNGGFYRALSREKGGSQDGINTHFGMADELHAHTNPDLVENMETSMAARAQAMLFQITTAGVNQVGICFATRSLCAKILKGTVKADHYFGIVFTLDKEDDWTDPAVWPKANPNWGVSIDPKKFQAEFSEAVADASKQGYFVTKRLNVWRNAKSAWMEMRAWQKAADPTLKLADFAKEECVGAVDLAKKVDVAALVLLFKRKNVFYLFPFFWLPEEAAEGGENSHYAGWAAEGFITLTPGNVTDQNYIQDQVRHVASHHQMRSLAYDDWQAHKFASELADEGMTVREYPMQVKTMSEPMKELHALVLSGKLRHPDNPVMNWMVSNVVAHEDAKENIFPRKEQRQNKIDGPVAAIMALGEWMTLSPPKKSIYETRGFLTA